VSVTYWMNSLQRLDSRRNYFVSLNPPEVPRDETVLTELTYEHPVFDTGALEAHDDLGRIQGRDRLWFCGAWTGYGFHEDGIRSGYAVARALGARIPWEEQAKASRDLVVPPKLVAQPA
jgi:predicted NAD/FAD-binding protein